MDTVSMGSLKIVPSPFAKTYNLPTSNKKHLMIWKASARAGSLYQVIEKLTVNNDNGTDWADKTDEQPFKTDLLCLW